MSKLCDFFSFEDSRFSNNMSKENTARVSMWHELQIPSVFTLEASFHGYFDRDKVNYEFTESTYEQMGVNLVNALYEYVMILEEDERRK